jgi:hypothetical protein
VEFLIVTFEEDRGVIVNSAPGAWRTNQLLMLEAGTYTIALEAPANFSPAGIGIVLEDATAIEPYEITFTKIPS